MFLTAPLLRSATIGLLVISPVVLSGALIIDGGAPDSTNIRFANDPAFIAGDSLAGVGRSGFYDVGRWGTLISPGVIIAANHFHPEPGQSIQFFATNDPLGPSEIRTVLAGQRIGASDVWVGLLGESLPASYAPFPLISVPITNSTAFNNSPIFEQVAFMIGRSDNTPYSVTNHAAGRNRIDYWYQQLTDGSTTDLAIAAIEDIAGDSNLVPDEAFLQYYDSGAPLLMELDGILTLVGINWVKFEQVDVDPRPFEKLRNISGFSYLGNYAAPIQAVIDAYALDATAGYLAWRSAVFGLDTDLAVGGPALDSDLDGLLNFLEYAFVTNPLDGAHPAPVASSPIELDGSAWLEATFSTRADPDLQYFVNVGENLVGWTRVDLQFDGSSWTTSDPDSVMVASASNLGGGIWQLVVRAPDPLLPGAPRFLAPGVE